jgi:hypothetical protein
VRAALQVLHAKSAAPEELSGLTDVCGLASVGRAHERDRGVVEAEPLLASGEQQGHRLEGLRRGSRVDREPGVAALVKKPTSIVDHRQASAVRRFHVGPAVHPGEHRGGLRHGAHYGNIGYSGRRHAPE